MQALMMASAVDEQAGINLMAAMQSCLLKDVDFEPERYPMPVRDVPY